MPSDENRAPVFSLAGPRARNLVFFVVLALLPVAYAAFVVILLLGGTLFAPGQLAEPMTVPELRHAAWLSLGTSISAVAASLAVAIPGGYLLSRVRFPGRTLVDVIIDLPIVLPPLVVGICLLIFFRSRGGQWIEEYLLRFTYAIPGIILAQFTVSCAFAIRTMKAGFDATPVRPGQVARTLGASRWRAFRTVELPMVRGSVLAAAILAWSRALGEFGPILVFVGTTRNHTEVLSTAIFLEMSVGKLELAMALSAWLAGIGAVTLLGMRAMGGRFEL